MRICILNEYFYPDMMGGTGMVLSDLARRMTDVHGVQVDVWTSGNSYRGGNRAYSKTEDWQGIHIQRIQVAAVERSRTRQRLVVNAWFAFLVFLRLLFRHPYDCIVVSTAPPALGATAWLMKVLFRIPYLYVIYDLEPDRAVALKVANPDSVLVKLAKKLQRKWLQKASRIVAIGRCMKEHLASAYRLDPETISVVEVGADPQSIVPGPKHNRFRELVGNDKFLVLNAGNFARYHDFDAVLDAAIALKESDPEVHFLLVGNGVKEEHVRQRIANEGISNASVMPFVADDEYGDLLAAADVSLVTLEEGMLGLCVPSKFYSILASGRPTLAMMSSQCEVAQVIAEDRCGEVVESACWQNLAAAVRRMKANPALLEAMGRNARKSLETRFNYARVAEKLYRLLTLENKKGADTIPFPVPEKQRSRHIM